MSVEETLDRDISVSVDPDANRPSADVTERRELTVEDLFNDDGELRLWEAPAGWNGYLHEATDDGPAYYCVNGRHDTDDWLRKVRVWKQAVHEAVRDHINDPQAGGRGRFVRRCTPP